MPWQHADEEIEHDEDEDVGNDADVFTQPVTPPVTWTATRCGQILYRLEHLVDLMGEWHTKFLEQDQGDDRQDKHLRNEWNNYQKKKGKDNNHNEVLSSTTASRLVTPPRRRDGQQTSGVVSPLDYEGRDQDHDYNPGSANIRVPNSASKDPAWLPVQPLNQKKNKSIKRYGGSRRKVPSTHRLASPVLDASLPAPPKTPDAKQSSSHELGDRITATPFITACVRDEVKGTLDGGIGKQLSSRRRQSIEATTTQQIWDKYGTKELGIRYDKIRDRLAEYLQHVLVSTAEDSEGKSTAKPKLKGNGNIATPPLRKGASSLLGMCQRQLGRLIVDERAVFSEEAPDEIGWGSPASQVLKELEDLYGDEIGNGRLHLHRGTKQGKNESVGWKPLREITRSLGIGLVTNAVQREVIDAVTTRSLISTLRHLSREDVNDAIEQIWLALLSQEIEQGMVGMGTCLHLEDMAAVDGAENAGLVTVVRSKQDCKHVSFQIQLMQQILRCHENPSGVWLYAHQPGWTEQALRGVIKSTSTSWADITFLQNMIVQYLTDTNGSPCGSGNIDRDEKIEAQHIHQQKNEDRDKHDLKLSVKAVASERRMKNISLLLTFTQVTQGVAVEKQRVSLPFQVMHGIATYLQGSVASTSGSSTSTTQRRCHLWFFIIFAFCQDETTADIAQGIWISIERMLRGLDGSSLFGQQVSSEVATDVVKFCQNAGIVAPRETLNKFISGLMADRVHDYPLVHEIICRTVVEMAMTFAELQSDTDSFDWALSIQNGLHTQVSTDSVPPKPVFRWEESIDAWVEKTPVRPRKMSCLSYGVNGKRKSPCSAIQVKHGSTLIEEDSDEADELTLEPPPNPVPASCSLISYLGQSQSNERKKRKLGTTRVEERLGRKSISDLTRHDSDDELGL